MKDGWVVWRTKGAKVLPVSLPNLSEETARRYAAEWSAVSPQFGYTAQPMCERARAHFARWRERLVT
jgi:hypothetical protein